MPSSYSFNNNPAPPQTAGSSSYRLAVSPTPNSGLSSPPTTTAPEGRHNSTTPGRRNSKINNDLNLDSNNTSSTNGGGANINVSIKKESTKSQGSGSNAASSSATANKDSVTDPDAKWKANYVPTVYNTSSSSTSGAGKQSTNSSSTTDNNITNGGSSLGDGGGGGGASNIVEDERDARWRANYVPTSFGLGKVEVEEGLPLPPPLRVGGSKEGLIPRQQWTNKKESVIACLGLTIGLSNVFRFPYLAYNHGGGAFLVPYVVFLVLVGMPLYFMELGVGQYSQLGALNVWKCSAAMQGIGMAMTVLSLLTAIYYSQMIAYCFYYVFATLAHIGHPLPWSTCGQPWTTAHCYEMDSGYRRIMLGNTTIVAAAAASVAETAANTELRQSSAYQYFRNQVLHQPVFGELSDQIGLIRWDLTLCLLLCWLIVFLVMVRGVRSTGKLSYFTTLQPICGLFILMIRALLMEGSDKGLLYLFVPRWAELGNPTVWKVALEQVLFSLSVSYGAVITYGSYNNFRSKAHFYAVGICIGNFLVSVVASIVVFSVLGAMAHNLGVRRVDQLPDLNDHSLAYVTLPAALSTLPVPHLGSFIFFACLVQMGIGSLVGHVHTLVAGLQDTMKSLRSSRVSITGVMCCCCFLLTLPLCAEQRGFFLLNLLSRYGIGLSVLVLAACELLTVSWLYGVRRLGEDFAFMLGYVPSMFWKVCWTFVSPSILVSITIYSIVLWSDPDALLASDPSWAMGVRWALTAVTIAFIPLVFCIVLLKQLCTKGLSRLFSPSLCWGPGDCEARSQLLAARAAGTESKMGLDNPALAYNS